MQAEHDLCQLLLRLAGEGIGTEQPHPDKHVAGGRVFRYGEGHPQATPLAGHHPHLFPVGIQRIRIETGRCAQIVAVGVPVTGEGDGHQPHLIELHRHRQGALRMGPEDDTLLVQRTAGDLKRYPLTTQGSQRRGLLSGQLFIGKHLFQ